MKGYWHIVGISVGISILAVSLNGYWFVVCLFLWLFYLFYNERLWKLPLIISLTFFTFFFLYIPSNEVTTNKMNEQITLPKTNQFSGKVIEPIRVSDSKVDFIFQEKDTLDKLLVIYFLDKESPNFSSAHYSKIKYGATCEITGKLELPDTSRNPGQFDYRNYLLQQGIRYQFNVSTLEDIHCEGSSFRHRIYDIRINLIDYVLENRSEQTAAWLNALVLGDDTLLDEEVVDLFQRWSLSHILAISGLHVGLVIALLYFLFVKLNLFTREKAQWIIILFLPFYALVAGGEPSVMRASITVLALLILNKTKIKLSMTDILSIVFILLILYDKHIVYHIGFQFSFIVTLGLILSKEWLSQSTSLIWKVLQISFVSQMMILPLQMTYFSTFQPLSILLNAIVVPYFTLFVIPFMFFLLLLSPLPNSLIAVVDQFFVKVQTDFISILTFIDTIAYSPWIIGDFPIVITFLYYLLFIIFMKMLEDNKLAESFKYGFIITMLITFLALRPYMSPVGLVTMLDIGQGDAFVIELPYRKGVFFIDAGSSFSFNDHKPTEKVYEQIIKPYLFSRGIRSIDAIIVSHEHIDHMGSVPFILKEMKVDQIIISEFYEFNNDEELWLDNGVQINRVSHNDQIVLNGQTFQVLAPTKNKQDANENSLVLYTMFGGKNWLFTGDIYKRTEKEIIGMYDNLSVDVLKVGHHGSSTSTDETFVNKISPEYALISAGINNSHGHPTMEVIKTLEEAGVIILRTDEDGVVQFQFKNNTGNFFRYLP